MERTWVSKNARETRRIAERFAHALKKSRRRVLVVGLVGELGAGKTFFVQCVARALGVRARMPSPTFLVVRSYPLPKETFYEKLYHVDAYRIKTKRDLDNTGLSRILQSPRSLIFIEWADRVKNYLPKSVLMAHLRHGKNGRERIITVPSIR